MLQFNSILIYFDCVSQCAFPFTLILSLNKIKFLKLNLELNVLKTTVKTTEHTFLPFVSKVFLFLKFPHYTSLRDADGSPLTLAPPMGGIGKMCCQMLVLGN